jgi:O-antigen ligase
MLVMALATLSRAAWVALFISFLTFVYIYRVKIKKSLPKNALSVGLTVLLFLLPIVWYMSIFLTSNTVKSSNDARLEMSKISMFYTLEKPWLGHGPGTFIYLLADTEIFRYEYGDPLDSHGIVQKILIEEGIIGLVAFSIFIYLILRLLWQVLNSVKKEDNEYLVTALFVMIVGSLTFQLFNTSYYKAVLWLPLGISLTTTVFYLSSKVYEKNK